MNIALIKRGHILQEGVTMDTVIAATRADGRQVSFCELAALIERIKRASGAEGMDTGEQLAGIAVLGTD
jgi:hypothetical protein